MAGKRKLPRCARCFRLRPRFCFPTALALLFDLTGQQYGPLFLAVMLMFVILGLLDDFLGDGVKGFRGHFTPGHLSTGVVKAVGGILVAGAASFHIASGWWGGLPWTCC